jgi:hypothetical protein
VFRSNIITIWFGSDFIVIGFIAYSTIICIVDLTFGICKRIIKRTACNIHCHDIMLGHIIVIGCIILVADMAFGFLHILVIVDYVDARSSILRAWIISRFICLYSILGVISSILLAIRVNSQRLRWFVYGLFLNCFAVLYYWKTVSNDQRREELLQGNIGVRVMKGERK